MDQDSTFMSSLMNYLFRKFDINDKTLAPYNHQSLQAEHGVRVQERKMLYYLSLE